MSKQDVDIEILTPMQRIFVAPRAYKKEEEQRAALAEYVTALEHFSAADLKAAWNAVRDTQTARSWPMPGVFVVHAVRCKHEREAKEGKSTAKAKHQGGGNNAPWLAWEAARRTGLAEEACRLGVAWALRCTILSGLQPNAIDLQRLVREKESAEAMARRIEEGKPLFSRSGRDCGVMTGQNRVVALDMYRGLLVAEATTQQEIGYTGGNLSRPAVDIEGLAT